MAGLALTDDPEYNADNDPYSVKTKHWVGLSIEAIKADIAHQWPTAIIHITPNTDGTHDICVITDFRKTVITQ